MSLLMEALKQQQNGPTPPQPHTGYGATESGLSARSAGQGWKILALVLLVLVGLLAGFLLASWLQRPAPVAAVVVAPPQPASAGQILTELLSVPVTSELKDPLLADTLAESEDTEPQLLVSAQKPMDPARLAGQTIEQQLQVIESSDDAAFVEEPVMAEADVDEPVTEGVATPPELTPADVSEELRNKFALALEQSDPMPRHQSVTSHAAPARDIQTLDDLLKRQIPPLRFEAHIYASDPKQRWVKVNGKDLQEGQWVTADIQLKEITPQYVLLQNGRQMFSMEALTEWSYRLPTP
jgi:general secretion pathway protein B